MKVFIASSAELIHGGEWEITGLVTLMNARVPLSDELPPLIDGVTQSEAQADDAIEAGECVSSMQVELRGDIGSDEAETSIYLALTQGELLDERIHIVYWEH